MLAGCHQADSPPAERSRERTGSASPRNADQAVLQARSIRVQDGDSFTARTADGRSLTIRLSGIDAPERSQPLADQSRDNLQRMLAQRDLQVRIAKYDAYDRAVAQVFSSSDGVPIDVGLAQVEGGMAWFFRRYHQDLPVSSREPYDRAEQAARTQRRGLWQSGTAEPPWDFRRRQQSRAP